MGAGLTSRTTQMKMGRGGGLKRAMMRSRMPRTIIPDKPLHPPIPPKPSQSGLPDDFDFDGYHVWEQRRSFIQAGVTGALILVVGFLYLRWATNSFTGFTGEWGLYSVVIFMFLILPGSGIGSTMIMHQVMRDHWKRPVARHRDALRRHEGAKKDWDDRHLETGITYWREMRGVAFERAVSEFLTRRGARVTMTKGSGDGGIDLVVELGAMVFWGQCKGHANPISVAPIREIAGVCSRSSAKPIVFAVNGYTRSAKTTAEDLGVLLFDAHHFVAMAKSLRIGEIDPSIL